MHPKTSSGPPAISAVLITKNEAENLYDCLASLSFCDEIIVLDSGSTDETTDIAKRLGARVISTDQWLGFGPQKQKALSAATGTWVLSIDADERVSERLREEILEAVGKGESYSYRLSRKNFFLGKEMRFGGWSGDWVTRLAKRDHCQFSSDLVHESLECAHPTKRLSRPLIHFSYRDIHDVFEKQIRYAELGATKLTQTGRSIRFPTLRAVWTFLRLYILQLGFLDGWRGTLAATAKSYETFWRYALASKRVK
jgi:glycosyltransferase involved in cell wall biosynthesis